MINRFQAGPFRAGVIRFGWNGPSANVPERHLWAFPLDSKEMSDHEELSKNTNWVRIYSPGWYYLEGTTPEDLTVVPTFSADHPSEWRTALQENAVHERVKEMRSEIERARAAGFNI